MHLQKKSYLKTIPKKIDMKKKHILSGRVESWGIRDIFS